MLNDALSILPSCLNDIDIVIETITTQVLTKMAAPCATACSGGILSFRSLFPKNSRSICRIFGILEGQRRRWLPENCPWFPFFNLCNSPTTLQVYSTI